jgi:hypothetical protein
MKTVRYIFFISLLITSFASAQQVSINVSKQRILLGEPFTISLKVFAPAGKNIQWFKIDSIPHFEILERSKVDSLREGNDFIIQQNLILTSWDSGSRILPPLILPNSNSRTQPIKIEVAFTSPWDPNKDYNPVKDIIDVQQPERTTWYWFVIAALFLLLLLILIFPKNKKPKQKKKVVVNAYDIAMKELKELQQRADSAQNKEWYTALINVFRNYLYHKKDIESHAKTSDDLAVLLRKENLDTGFQSQLLQTLRLSDAVKFAKYEASTEQKEESIQTIKKAIQTIEGKA